jgi:oligopeptide/dipeptide ABC transporter ATP-binding protein
LFQKELGKEEPDFSCTGKLPEGFLDNLAAALKYAEEKVMPEKAKAVAVLREAVSIFEKEQPQRKDWEKAAKELSGLVDCSINPLSIHGNSYAATFQTTMEKGIKRYFKGVKENPAELKRVEKETEKRDATNVVPPVLVDLKLTQKSMVTTLQRLADSYEKELAEDKETDYHAQALEMTEKLQTISYAMINKITRQMAYDKAVRIMEDVGIKEPQKRFKQYPFEFSGGMRQRIVIAIAIAANPDILICDEPTTALDVTIQAQIMELINEVKRKRQLSVIFITHDLGVVANMADKVAVMYAGKIVKYGTADDVFYHPAHPYTWALLASMPDLDTKEKLEAIPGTPPNMIYPPVGDAFAERNQYAMQIDYEKQPPLFRISDTHYAATWLLHPDAPRVEPPKSVTERIKRMKELEAASNE